MHYSESQWGGVDFVSFGASKVDSRLAISLQGPSRHQLKNGVTFSPAFSASSRPML